MLHFANSDGEYKGCCAFDEFCGGLGCGSINSDRVAAGCTFDDDVTPPISQAPIPAPETGWPVHFWPDGFTAPRKDSG